MGISLEGERVEKHTVRPPTVIKALNPPKPAKYHKRALETRGSIASTARISTGYIPCKSMIGLKERSLIETMSALGISSLLNVSSRYEQGQIQLKRFKERQLVVTRLKVESKSYSPHL